MNKEGLVVASLAVVGGVVVIGNWWVAIMVGALAVKFLVLVPAEKERLAEFERELYRDLRMCAVCRENHRLE